MLRRKLVAIVACLVVMLLATAVGVILALQSTLGQLRHLQAHTLPVTELCNRVDMALIEAEVALAEIESQVDRPSALAAAVNAVQESLTDLRPAYAAHLPGDATLLERVQQHLDAFVGATSKVSGRQEALGAATLLRQDLLLLSRNVRDHTQAEQAALVGRFRWLVIALVFAFLVVINASVLVLVRAAAMVVRPVERLTEAARHLGDHCFDSALELDRKDEFGELARAYRSMAGQLETSERGKLETLGQVATTLNHDLNNAIAIIELQLQLLSRKTGGGAAVEPYARQIREGLARMSGTVEALKHVRRIVLTDYVAGVKMLDLQRSVDAGQQPAADPGKPGPPRPAAIAP